MPIVLMSETMPNRNSTKVGTTKINPRDHCNHGGKSAEDGGFSPNNGLTWSFIKLYSAKPKYSLFSSVVDSEKLRHISSAPGPHNHEKRDLYVLHYTLFRRPRTQPW